MNKNEKFVKAPKAKQNPLGPDGVPCGNVNQTGVCKNWRLFYYETCHTCNKKKQMIDAAAAKEVAIVPRQNGPAKLLNIKFAVDFSELLKRVRVVIEANPADMQTQELAREMKDLVVLIGKRAPVAPSQTNWLMVAQPHDLSPEEVMKMIMDTIKELTRVWRNLNANKIAAMGVGWEICPTDVLNANCKKGDKCTGVHVVRTGLFGDYDGLTCNESRRNCAEFVAARNGTAGYAPLPGWMPEAWSMLRAQMEENIQDQQAQDAEIVQIKAVAEARSAEEARRAEVAQATAELARIAAQVASEAAEMKRIEMLRLEVELENARAASTYAELEKQRLAKEAKDALFYAASNASYDASGNWVPAAQVTPVQIIWSGDGFSPVGFAQPVAYSPVAYSPSPAHFASEGVPYYMQQ